MKEYRNRWTDKQTSNVTRLYNSMPSISLTLAWSPIVSSPDHPSDTESAPAFRLQIKGLTKVQKGVVPVLEPGQRVSVGHWITLVTRYSLVDQVEREVNSVLMLSFIGNDRQSGLYNLRKACTLKEAKTRSCFLWYQCPDTLC